MEKVLARREVNRKTLDQYILDETESFEILGPGRWPLYRTKRDYTWYVRDGMHVRSPVRYNGVKIGEEARQRYETNWIRRERERQERARRRSRRRKKEKAPARQATERKDAEPSKLRLGMHRPGGGAGQRRRQPDADRAAVRLRGLFHGLQVRGRATTTWPAARSSKATTC